MKKQEYPLFYDVREVLQSRTVKAEVIIHGTALAIREQSKEWWIYGANPGGIAEGSRTFQSAFETYCIAIRNVLRDFASEGRSLAQFRNKLNEFFYDRDNQAHTKFKELCDKIRSGDIKPTGEYAKLNPVPRTWEKDVEINLTWKVRQEGQTIVTECGEPKQVRT